MLPPIASARSQSKIIILNCFALLGRPASLECEECAASDRCERSDAVTPPLKRVLPPIASARSQSKIIILDCFALFGASKLCNCEECNASDRYEWSDALTPLEACAASTGMR